MRFGSSPFPPPFSGHRHRRVGGGGNHPGGGDCAGAHRSRPQRRGRGTLPTNPPRGLLRLPSEGRPVPDFERLPLGSYKQSSSLSPEPRVPTYAEESRVHLAASLGDRSLSQRAPRRRDGGRDRQKGAQRREAARAATPAPPLLRRVCGCACSVRHENDAHAPAHQGGRLSIGEEASPATGTNGKRRANSWVAPPYRSFFVAHYQRCSLDLS